VRSIVCRVSLLLVLIACSPMGFAVAQSLPVMAGPSILSANNIRNTTVDQAPVDPNASPDVGAIRASTGVLPDSETVKPKNPPVEPAPSPGGPKVSFWQWLSGRTVDCSSGVCTFK